jgi:DNA-binding MarR family transcriptional regulator
LGYSDFVISENESTELVLALQRASHVTQRALATRLADDKLTASEINVLANLADGQFRSVTDLATVAGTKPTTLTSILDRLTKRGYLGREVDLGDRRSLVVHLTPEGAAVAARAQAATAEVGQESTGSLSKADLTGFMNVARALGEGPK